MLAFLAALAFAISLLLHLIGGHSADKYWIDFALAGAVFLTLHLAFGEWRPWVRTPRP